jgi:hypothetical protein
MREIFIFFARTCAKPLLVMDRATVASKLLPDGNLVRPTAPCEIGAA